MFCKHDDELIDKEVIPPPAKTCNITSGSGECSLLFETTVIHIFKCSKCKRIRRLVTRT